MNDAPQAPLSTAPKPDPGNRRCGPPLLAADEPPAFSVINANADSSLVLCCDHASHHVPNSLRNLDIDSAALHTHIGWDIGAADVARHMAARLSAVLIVANYSRLVIDINRTLGHAQSIVTHSDNVKIPANQKVDALEAQRRADACYWPYHRTLGALVTSAQRRGTSATLVSVHSFTPVFNDIRRPWQIGVLWDRDEHIAESLIEHLRGREICVGNNQPYDARDTVGYTTLVHAGERGVRNVLIEIRQDLVDSEKGAREWAGVLSGALEAVLPHLGSKQ